MRGSRACLPLGVVLDRIPDPFGCGWHPDRPAADHPRLFQWEHDGICGVSATARRHRTASAAVLPAVTFMLLSRPPAWNHIFDMTGPNVDDDEDFRVVPRLILASGPSYLPDRLRSSSLLQAIGDRPLLAVSGRLAPGQSLQQRLALLTLSLVSARGVSHHSRSWLWSKKWST